MARGEADKWLLHGNVWLLYGVSWLWVIALLLLSVDWGNCCLSESGWWMVMQSAQRWRGRSGEAWLSSLSTSVFTRKHVVSDNMYLNVSVFKCLYSLCVHAAEWKCAFLSLLGLSALLKALLLFCCVSCVSVLPHMNVVRGELQVMQMRVCVRRVYLSLCESQQRLHKCLRCISHNSLVPNGLRLLNLCAADLWCRRMWLCISIQVPQSSTLFLLQ